MLTEVCKGKILYFKEEVLAGLEQAEVFKFF